ncbi:BUD13 homolog [Zophobas morio]|uniref:BUD13 homolog n=1 Tax=Zophobas morio TaxID=2755281 RepID=UPI00308339A6
MADGTKAGLLTSKEIKEINALKRAREKNSTFSERESQTTKAVIRDKTGKRIDPELIREQKKIEEEKEKERMVKYQQWSAGTTQLKLRQEKLKEEEHEAKKAFTRYRSDEDLDKYYRNRARADDPMARFLNKKKDQDKPVYKGPLPPTNRYGILPGYRWDGVDRSNGFEKKLMEAQANRLSRAAEVYTWSTEDM